MVFLPNFLYVFQPFSFIGFPRELNFIFLVFPFLYFLKEICVFDKKILIYVLIMLAGSFLYSDSWSDVGLILAKIIICVTVGLVAYQFGKKTGSEKWVILGVLSLLSLDAWLRYICFAPNIQDLLIGPIGYKMECTVPFHDSNTSGNIAIQLLLIFHLLLHRSSKVYWWGAWASVLIVSTLTASKSSFIGCFLFLAIILFETVIRSRNLRKCFYVVTCVTIFALLSNFLNIDASLDTKIGFVRELERAILNEPYKILFGHGYITGKSFLAGGTEFSHALLSLLLGTVGVFGTIAYGYLFFHAYSMNNKSYVAIVLLGILSFSYFPPFFELYVYLAFFFCGLNAREINARSDHKPAPVKRVELGRTAASGLPRHSRSSRYVRVSRTRRNR